MKAILLDGSQENDCTCLPIRSTLAVQLQTSIASGEKNDRQLRQRFLLLDPRYRRMQCNHLAAQSARPGQPGFEFSVLTAAVGCLTKLKADRANCDFHSGG